MRPNRVFGEIEPLRTVPIGTEVVDFCLDGPRLLFLDRSGERIIAFDTAFTISETLPISGKIILARGIYADRYYIYVYDEQTLFRIAKTDFSLSPWLNNVRVSGIVTYPPAGLLISDDDRQCVWLKSIFGESRVFFDRSEVSKPGALTVFPDGVYGVISNGTQLLKFNRAGIILRSIIVPQNVDLLTNDKNGRAFLMRKGDNIIWLVSENNLSGYILRGVMNPVALECHNGRILVIDGGKRIVVYPVPGV